jgi:hypothetical protein
MILFGTVCGYPEKLAQFCAPGLARSMAGGTYAHLVRRSNGSDLFRPYAEMMAYAERVEAEALVLIHDDLEFRDTRLEEKVCAAVAEADVTGLIGSTGAKSLAWWDGERRGRVEDSAYGLHDFGGFGLPVEAIDGMCIILSPGALKYLQPLRASVYGFHGYADELCRQAMQENRRVTVADIGAFHHSLGGYAGGIAEYEKADEAFKKRWIK